MLSGEHIYTQEELDSLTIHDLRIVLSKIGGVPKLKNRQMLVDEITKIQDGTMQPTRTNRGRKPKFIKMEEMELAHVREEREKAGIPADDGYQSYGEQGYPVRDNSYYGSRPYDSRIAPSVGSHFGVADNDAKLNNTVAAQGVLEIMDGGYGFLRTYDCHFDYPDFYVDRQVLRRYGLKTGDYVMGYAVNKFDKSSLNVRDVTSINGIPVGDFVRGKYFDDYSAVYPKERLELSKVSDDYALRAIDLVSPVGKGQRGLIVAPPKTGKTTLLKKIAHAIEENYPEAYLIVLLIDERPEEVTDFASVVKRGEVVASTFDESPEKHVKFAEIYLERAKRLAESGKDVVLLLDSITKLARAYNNTIPSSGKTLSGGVDPQALIAPKKFFGAARNLKDGASLTVISTALVETGSRMDDVIFEEFKGTGNMEIVLSRHLSERRIFPAIDLFKSGTRNEEYLYDKDQAEQIYKLRRFLARQDAPAEALLEMVQKTTDNDDLLSRLDAWIKMFGDEQ